MNDITLTSRNITLEVTEHLDAQDRLMQQLAREHMAAHPGHVCRTYGNFIECDQHDLHAHLGHSETEMIMHNSDYTINRMISSGFESKNYNDAALRFVNDHKAELVEIGYEQAGCNDQGSVDADDALRLFYDRVKEGNYHLNTVDGFVLKNLSAEIEKHLKEIFNDEFPANRDPMESSNG